MKYCEPISLNYKNSENMNFGKKQILIMNKIVEAALIPLVLYSILKGLMKIMSMVKIIMKQNHMKA